MIAFLLVCALTAVSAVGQVSTDEAMSRLKARQAKRDAAIKPAIAPAVAASQPTTRPALELIGEFVGGVNVALREKGDNREAAIDRCFAGLFGKRIRIDDVASDLTTRVPLGDSGIFGDRPDKAIVVSHEENSGPSLQIYLAASNDVLDKVSKGSNLRGTVEFFRGNVEPEGQSNGDLRVGRVVLLGQFVPDPPTTAPLPASVLSAREFDPRQPIERAVIAPTLPRRIVFLCDASGSMLSKFDTLKRELSSAIGHLRPECSFNLIFFEEQTLKQMAGVLLPGTNDNKRRADQFMDMVVPRADTNPIPAIEEAFRESPDVIFLLTDGDFPNNAEVIRRIRELDRDGRVKIHTIAFVGDSDKDTDFMAMLKTIAKMTGGTYRYVRQSDL